MLSELVKDIYLRLIFTKLLEERNLIEYWAKKFTLKWSNFNKS